MLANSGRWQMQQDNNFLPCFYVVIVLSLNILLKMQQGHVQNIFWQPNNVDYNRAICRTPCFVLTPQLQHGGCAVKTMPSALASSPLSRVVTSVT
jgi:hypothetical protein